MSLQTTAGECSSLATIGFFDRYQGKGVPEGKVSLSLRLTFQADRTLTDAEVQAQFDAIVAGVRAYNVRTGRLRELA